MGGYRLKTKRICGGDTPGRLAVSGGRYGVQENETGQMVPDISKDPLVESKELPVPQKGKVKMSFTLSRDLHTRLKMESVRHGETIVAMVSKWIKETTRTL